MPLDSRSSPPASHLASPDALGEDLDGDGPESFRVRISWLPRRRITSVLLAGALLLMPLSSGSRGVYHSLSSPEVTILAFIGLAAGWALMDRLATLHVPLPALFLVQVAVATALWCLCYVVVPPHLNRVQGATAILAVAIVIGGIVRGPTDQRRSMASLVAITAVATWLAFDVAKLPALPLRDIHLYLGAGTSVLHGTSPYLTTPIAAVADPEKLPFVYPPFTIPVFELLASLPRPLAEAIWELGAVAAVLTALWLLGVRGRWLLILMAWPALAQGVAVGNVASFTFLLYVLGFRYGPALVMGGLFKVQSMIPTLWLFRERKWRAIAVGFGLIAMLSVLSIPVVGIRSWVDWPSGLRAFETSVEAMPSIQGSSLMRALGPLGAVAITAVAVGVAMLGRGRNGLARFGVASVVASPTLYVHGLSPLLAGTLFLGPELLWFFLGLGPWEIALGIRSAWIAMAFAGIALLAARGSDLRLPRDLSPSRSDIHPAAKSGQVWPNRT